MKLRVPYVGAGATIEEIYVQLNTAPGASALRVNILRNGLTVLDSTPYIEIAIGAYTASRVASLLTPLNKDDYLQWELVNGDSTAADLTIHVRYKWTMTAV
jgi:hypothetical protein